MKPPRDLRTEHVTIPLTPREKRAVVKTAYHEGLPVSIWMRRLIAANLKDFGK